LMVAVALGAMVSSVQADETADKVNTIKSSLESAKSRLDSTVDGLPDAQKVKVLEAIRKIDAALAATAELQKSLNSNGKLEGLVQEARVVQRLLGGYLGTKEFHGYVLK